MKYLLFLILGGVIVFVILTVFYKGNLSFSLSTNPSPVVSPTASALPATATPTAIPAKTIKGGGVLSFNAYTIDVPDDWSLAKETAVPGQVDLDKLTLTNDGYKITIYQAATGGAICLYSGDPDVEGPSSRFTTFVDLTTQSGNKLRRGATGTTTFTLCEKQGTNPWGEPTSFGHISIGTPATASKVMLDEIDSILSSLKKI